MFHKPPTHPDASDRWKLLKQTLWEWRGVVITAPLIAGVVWGLRLTGLLQPLEWAALDEFFRRRPPEPLDPTIVIVGITESDIQALGQWPMSDAVLAQLLNRIKQQQPRAIGLDLYRDLVTPPGHSELVKFYKTTPNFVGIEKVIGDENSPAIRPAPELRQLGQVGMNDIVADADGKIRRTMLLLALGDRDQEEWSESLGLKLAQLYLKAEGITPRPEAQQLELGRATFLPFQANDGAYVGADDAGYQLLLNFRGAARSFRAISAMDVLKNRIPSDSLRDRIVLIGPTAASLKDYFYTPYSNSWTGVPEQIAGVELQATAASQIVQSALTGRSQIQVWSDPIEGLWIFVWSGIGATLGWLLRSKRQATASLLLVGGGLVGGCFWAFLHSWWIPVVPPVLALMGAVTVINRYTAISEQRDRQIVMNLFGRHVAPEVANAIWQNRDQILQHGRVQGQQLTATVLFTDIQDFSHIAQTLEPAVLMAWLNEYMEAMAQLILEHGGIVDKFIGDGIMAVFGVPIPRTTADAIAHDAQQAVKCALAMSVKLETLNQRWQAQSRPIAAIRVGIATGEVVIGSLGGSQRLDYTIIGDSVNIASRLESHSKSFRHSPCRILVSEATYQLSQTCCDAELAGDILLRGRDQPMKVYQVLLSGIQPTPSVDAWV